MEATDLESLKQRLNGLATAAEKPIVVVDKTESGEVVPQPADEFKAIWNNKTSKVANIVSKNYALIQHKDAFEAVLDALAAMKENPKVKASVEEFKGRAYMTVVFEDIKADDGADGIEVGFKVSNSFDKSASLRYGGVQSKKHQEKVEEHFEFFGYRLVCGNGMTVRVPNVSIETEVKGAQAKVGDIVEVKLEHVPEHIKTTITEEAAVRTTIRHYGKNAIPQVLAVRDAFLKLPLVLKGLEEQIAFAKDIGMTREQAAKALKDLHFCDRTIEKLLEGFAVEEQNQWGLYNAITNYASHTDKLSAVAVERTLKMAQPLLVSNRGGESPSSQ